MIKRVRTKEYENCTNCGAANYQTEAFALADDLWRLEIGTLDGFGIMNGSTVLGLCRKCRKELAEFLLADRPLDEQ